ncbi:hypothetical protein AB0C13_40180 [Streptomyces sp. NPDC049099]|uniref:hypothetical protein n=1 Tax=Streptomyces sp. NPDC049099 TaxID=3155768 RepID=UPI003417C3D8
MENEHRTRIRLVESDDEQPKVRTTLGSRFEVVVATVVDSDLQAITDEILTNQAKRPPRLCGSRSTCLAIVEID